MRLNLSLANDVDDDDNNDDDENIVVIVVVWPWKFSKRKVKIIEREKSRGTMHHTFIHFIYIFIRIECW